MFEWIQQNSEALQLGSSIIMTVVWVVYLELLLRSFARQRRSMVLINLGAGSGLGARCFVSNLGFDPIYVIDIFVTLSFADGSDCKTFITDRSEIAAEDLNAPSDGTNQGPLKSGEYVDIGSLGDVMMRVRKAIDPEIELKNVDQIDLCVIAAAASSSSYVIAHRTYDVKGDAREELIPQRATTSQVRTPWGRRKFLVEMRRRY